MNGTYYSSIQSAYNAAATGSTINLWAVNYLESPICDRPVTVVLKGGYDSGYAMIIDNAVINGNLTVKDGLLIADGVTIK